MTWQAKKIFLSLLRTNTHTHTQRVSSICERKQTHIYERVQESSECEGENWEAHGSVTWQHKNRLISLSLSRVFLLPITPLFIFHHSLLLWTLLSVTFIEPFTNSLSLCTTIHNSAAAPLSYRSLLLIISQLPLTSSQSSLVIYASCRRSGATASSPSFFFVIFAYITDPFIN